MLVYQMNKYMSSKLFDFIKYYKQILFLLTTYPNFYKSKNLIKNFINIANKTNHFHVWIYNIFHSVLSDSITTISNNFNERFAIIQKYNSCHIKNLPYIKILYIKIIKHER